MWLTTHFHQIMLRQPERLVAPFNWQEHIPFAMWLVQALRPAVIVELGTHTGNSYCAFCQATHELGLDTDCSAIDSWAGDEQAGYYGDDVLAELRAHHDPRYAGFSRLIRSHFDDALPHFHDHSIDLLHIDGYHTYEAVRHDFEAWLPKMSARGVVLFHDTNVREKDFGVHRFWEELREIYPAFAFYHGHGLGIIAVGEPDAAALQDLFAAANSEAALIRDFFSRLGQSLTLQAESENLRTAVNERDTRIIGLFEKYDQDAKAYQRWIAERDQQLTQQTNQIIKQTDDIVILQGWIKERDELITKQTADHHILEDMIEKHEREITDLTDTIDSLEQDILSHKQSVADAPGLRQAIADRDAHIQKLHNYATETAQELGRLQYTMLEIQNSRGWKLLQRSWFLRQKLSLSVHQLKRGLRLPLQAARVWRSHGAGEVLRRSQQRLRQQRITPYAQDEALLSAPTSPAAIEAATDPYSVWIAAFEPAADTLAMQPAAAEQFATQPVISIVTPVYNPEPAVLQAMIDSVLAQTYQAWELWLIDGNPSNTSTRLILERAAASDARINLHTLTENEGIVGNTNAGIRLVTGEYVAFVDHDDTLAPFALFEVAKRINERAESDLIYSDSDLLSADGTQRFAPFFKPDWSPAIMLSANYATHLCVVRTTIIRELNGLASGTDGAQDWDFILRVSERTNAIEHIPKILYHWRESPGSTATDIKRKPYVMSAQVAAITQHLQRQGIAARAYFDTTGYIRVTWPLLKHPLVSIIIPSRNLQLVHQCISSIFTRTSYQEFEVIIVDTTHDGAIVRRYGQNENTHLRVLPYTAPFNYSAVNNMAVREAAGEILLFLNDDTEIIDSEWLTEMVRWATREQIGVVGAKLLTEDGRIQHAGVVVGMDGFAGHPFTNSPEGIQTIYGSVEWYRNYSAVTGACLMIRRSLFEQVKGFDEQLALCGNDVELCLRVGALGYQIFYTPFARIRHFENVTRGKDTNAIPKEDFVNSYLHYRSLLEHGDPFFNHNLSYWSSFPRPRRREEIDSLAFVYTFLGDLGFPRTKLEEYESGTFQS